MCLQVIHVKVPYGHPHNPNPPYNHPCLTINYIPFLGFRTLRIMAKSVASRHIFSIQWIMVFIIRQKCVKLDGSCIN